MKKSELEFQTPAWAAELIVQHFYPNLSAIDQVWEPTCGEGAFVLAFPEYVNVAACEKDPMALQRLRQRMHTTTVNCARAARLDLYNSDVMEGYPGPRKLTHVIGNPPFNRKLVEVILREAGTHGRHDVQVGLILPASMFQTSRSVMQWANVWDINVSLLPRDLFKGLQTPLVFAQFARPGSTAKLTGLSLFSEIACFKHSLRVAVQNETAKPTARGVWADLLRGVLADAPTGMTLLGIYQAIENNRPTKNPWWREQIRKVLYQKVDLFEHTGDRWSLKEP